MKNLMRRLSYFLCLFSFLSLSACSSTEAEPLTSTTDNANDVISEEVIESIDSQEKDETEPEETTPYTFIDIGKTTSEEIEQMVIEQGNRHGLNVFCYDNSWIYGAWAGEKYTGEVVKVRYDNSDWTVIDGDTSKKIASCQAVKSGYLYYSQIGNDGHDLVKVRSSGDDAKTIISGHQGAIQIVDNYIYYTTTEHWNDEGTAVTEDSAHLYRCDLNGENVEAILETPVYYFTVFGDNILYQDDKDGMTLHIYNIVSGENRRITEQRSFWPIFDGKYIYYLSDSTSPEEYHHTLWKMSLDGQTNEQIDVGGYIGGLLIRGEYIYYINMDDSWRIYRSLKDGSEIELVTQDSNVTSFQWVNDCLAYATRDDEGYIEGFFICDADGADKIEFCKSDDYWYLG